MMKYILLLFFIPVISFSQDLKFSFANNSNQFLNPANSGIRNLRSFTLIHRSQWPGLSGRYESTLFTYEQGYGFLRNFGFYLASDRSGRNAFAINDLGITYSYPLAISRNIRMSIGYTAVLKHTYVNLNKLTWPDPINPRTGFIFDLSNPRPHTFGMDNNFGLMLYSRHLYLGLSAKHLIRINHQEHPSYNVQAGYQMYLPTKSKYKYLGLFRAGISYSYQNDIHRMQVNSSVIIKRFILGGAIGNYQNYSLMAGFQTRIRLNISYIYEQITSPITNARGGTHEIMIRFDPFIRCCHCHRGLFGHSDF